MTEPTALQRAAKIIGDAYVATKDFARVSFDERREIEAAIEQAILAAETEVREPLVDAAELFRARAVEFESQVAALRDDLSAWFTGEYPDDDGGELIDLEGDAAPAGAYLTRQLLADTAASAEAYTARIREQALEEAVSALENSEHDTTEGTMKAALKAIRALAAPPATNRPSA